MAGVIVGELHTYSFLLLLFGDNQLSVSLVPFSWTVQFSQIENLPFLSCRL